LPSRKRRGINTSRCLARSLSALLRAALALCASHKRAINAFAARVGSRIHSSLFCAGRVPGRCAYLRALLVCAPATMRCHCLLAPHLCTTLTLPPRLLPLRFWRRLLVRAWRTRQRSSSGLGRTDVVRTCYALYGLSTRGKIIAGNCRLNILSGVLFAHIASSSARPRFRPPDAYACAI